VEVFFAFKKISCWFLVHSSTQTELQYRNSGKLLLFTIKQNFICSNFYSPHTRMVSSPVRRFMHGKACNYDLNIHQMYHSKSAPPKFVDCSSIVFAVQSSFCAFTDWRFHELETSQNPPHYANVSGWKASGITLNSYGTKPGIHTSSRKRRLHETTAPHSLLYYHCCADMLLEKPTFTKAVYTSYTSALPNRYALCNGWSPALKIFNMSKMILMNFVSCYWLYLITGLDCGLDYRTKLMDWITGSTFQLNLPILLVF